MQMPLPALSKAQVGLLFGQSASLVQDLPPFFQMPQACALFAMPKAVSAATARPTPTFFNAARRVTDCARPLLNSSNWVFMVCVWWWMNRWCLEKVRSERKSAPVRGLQVDLDVELHESAVGGLGIADGQRGNIQRAAVVGG